MAEFVYFGSPYDRIALYKIVDGKREFMADYRDIRDMLDDIQEDYEYATLICGSVRE